MPSPDIASGTYTRRIVTRSGVGATARVHQVSEVRIASLLVMEPSLIVVLNGQKVISHGTTRLQADAGEAIFLREGRYDVINRPDDRPYEAFWLAWAPESLDRYQTDSKASVKSDPCHLRHLPPAMMEALRRAHADLDNPTLPDVIAQHRMEEVLLWLVHSGIPICRRPSHGLPAKVSAMIAAEPGRAWCLEDIAERLIVSEATLRRQLSAAGTGFSELLIDSRMSVALSLLQSTDLPIGHIAADVGYESPSRFSVRFRARFGFAPTAIRGHHRPQRTARL